MVVSCITSRKIGLHNVTTNIVEKRVGGQNNVPSDMVSQRQSHHNTLVYIERNGSEA